jgi:Peptidase propeptide and YPEB domain
MMSGSQQARPRRMVVALALSMLVMAGAAARADDKSSPDRDDDAEIVYQGLKTGRFMPLVDILAKLRLPPGSEMVNIALEDEHGVPVYEIYYIEPDGRRREIRLDARSGEPVVNIKD